MAMAAFATLPPLPTITFPHYSPPRSWRMCLASAASFESSYFRVQPSVADLLDVLADKAKGRPNTVAGVDQSILVEPWLLADPDSRFAEYNGVQIHYKMANVSDVKNVEKKDTGVSGTAAILLHGFGASLFSWERIYKQMAQAIACPTIAFDRPAFGLSSRPSLTGEELDKEHNPYALEFSSSVALAFIDQCKAEKGILIGHSAGCIVAAEAYFDAPEKIAAIVMIAPAIMAPFISAKHDQKRMEMAKNLLIRVLSPLIAAFKWCSTIISHIVERFSTALGNLYRRFLISLFRSQVAIWMIRFIMDKYGQSAVRYACYDANKADKHVLRGYTKPLRCRHWDKALLEYVLALVTSPLKDQKEPLSSRLGEISCPVLVITGENDRLVPAWNAKRLAPMFPKSHLEVIEECGHLPHEEKPQEVIVAVSHFLANHGIILA